MKRVVIVAGLLVFAGALAAFYTKEAKLLKQTCFNYAGYKILELSVDKIRVQINLNLLNRSDISVTLKSYNLDIFLNNNKVSNLQSNTPQLVDRNGFAPLTLMVDIVPKNVLNFNVLSNILLDFNNVMVKIQGNVSINAAGVNKSVPVLIESKLVNMIPTGPKQPCSA